MLKAIFKIIVVLLISSFSRIWAQACDNESQGAPLWGKWQFKELIFEGERRPPFNPNLILTFEFFESGESILRWERSNEEGFCERRGRWSWDGVHLRDEVIWVNPENNRDCSMDPDMQLGRKTVSRAELVDGDIHLHLPVNESVLIYIFKKL